MRFSIRDMLWLTAFAALAACWLSDRQRVIETKAELKAQQDLARKEQDAARAERDVARTESAASRAAFNAAIHDYRDAARLYEQLTPAPTGLRRSD
jgi:hypothetical protein